MAPLVRAIKTVRDCLAGKLFFYSSDCIRGRVTRIKRSEYQQCHKSKDQPLPKHAQIKETMPQNYTIRPVALEEKEVQAVTQFTVRIFDQDEPLNAASRSHVVAQSDIEEHLIGILQQSLSVLALDDGGEIVGVSLNGLITKEEAEINSFESDCEDGIVQLLLHLRREDKMWEKLPKACSTVLELQHCAVRSDRRGKGIMTALCKETELIARTTCAGAMRIETSSAFSAKAAEKLGYKEIYRLAYKDQTYTPPPAPPHLDIRVYIKEL